MSQGFCDYQKDHNGSCVLGPGDYCHGNPEKKYCNLFMIKNGPGCSSVWASDIVNARKVLDIGMHGKKSIDGPLEGIVQVVQINNRDFAIQIAKRSGLKPEDFVN